MVSVWPLRLIAKAIVKGHAVSAIIFLIAVDITVALKVPPSHGDSALKCYLAVHLGALIYDILQTPWGSYYEIIYKCCKMQKIFTFQNLSKPLMTNIFFFWDKNSARKYSTYSFNYSLFLNLPDHFLLRSSQ